MKAHEYIEYIKDKYPGLSSSAGGNERRIYNVGMRLENDEGIKTNHIEPYAVEIERDESLGNNFLGNAGSYFVDLTNWGDTVKDAYNNSIMGIYEQAMTGELPYELTIDPKTGEPIDLHMLQKGASFVMSMFMPADIAAFFTGGKLLGTLGSQVSKVAMGGKLRKEVTKKLASGYRASGELTRDAERMASKKASQLLTNPSRFATRKPVYQTFVDKKTKQEFQKEIFNGQNIADAWKLNANVIGGQLMAHRGLQESVSIMYEKGQQDEETGEWIPGELKAEDWGRISKGMAKSYVTGVAVGGVKALAGKKAVHAWKGDDTLRGYMADAAEFGAESLVFGSVDPLLSGRIPTMEELKHSAGGLLAIKSAGAASSRVLKTLHDHKLKRQQRNEDLKERVRFREDMSSKSSNEQVKDILKTDNLKDLKELKFNVDNEFDYSFFTTFTEKIKTLEKELDKFGGDNYELVDRTFRDLGERDINIILDGELSRAKQFIEQAKEKALNDGTKLSESHHKLIEDIGNVEKYLTDFKKIKEKEVDTHKETYVENDIDVIETFLKDSNQGGASGSMRQLDGHVKQSRDSSGALLFWDNNNQRTTRVGGQQVLEFKNDAARNHIIKLTRDAQQAQRKMRSGKTIEDLYEDASFRVDNPSLESNLIQWVYKMDWGGGKNSTIAAENKKIIGALLKKHLVDRFPDNKNTRGKLGELHSFSKWLADNHNINLAGSNKSEGVLRNLFNEYLRTGKNGKAFAEGTWEVKRTKLNQFFSGDALASYIGYNPIPGKTFKTSKAKFVNFVDNDAAALAIKETLGKDRNGFVVKGGISEKNNITNLEWSVFHRLIHRGKARLQDARGGLDKNKKEYGIKVGDYNPNTRILTYVEQKTIGKKAGAKVKTIDLNKFPDLHLDLVEFTLGKNKADYMFPNIFKYGRKSDVGSIKAGFLESISTSGKDAEIYVDFQKNIKVDGQNYINAGDVLKIGEAGTEKAQIRSIWRTAEHGWDVERIKKERDQSGFGIHEFYIKRAGLESRIKSTEIKSYLEKEDKIVFSKFVKDVDKNQILTKDNYKDIVKWFKKRNPNTDIENIKLGEGISAKTTFKTMRDVISVELGKTDLKGLFHENMEIIFEHAKRSGDKKLLEIINKGIESTAKDAKFEWKLRGGAKGTGYKDFNLFKKEYFMEMGGKFGAGKFVQTKLVKRISNWMKEMFVELKRYFFGIESEKLTKEDYIMLVGRRAFKGVDTLADRNYRKPNGEVVYSKFTSNKSKDDVENSRRFILKKLEKRTEESGIPTSELFNQLKWKERFGVKSFGEITDRKTASILLKDLEMRLDMDKINNSLLAEQSIDYTSNSHKGSKGTYASKGGVFGYLKSGEFQQFILNPYSYISKFAWKNSEGKKYVETVLEPFNRDHQRNQGMLLELKEYIADLGLKDKELDHISTYASEVHGKKLSKEAKLFLEKSKIDGTPQNLAVKATKSYLDTWYKKKLPDIIDQRFNARIADKLKKKLKSREVKNYLTHSLNPKLKEFLLKEKEGETQLRKIVEQNIILDWKSTKEFTSLMGKIKKAEKKLRKALEDENSVEINTNRQALELFKNKLNESKDKLFTTEAIDKAYNEAVRQVEYSTDYIFNPNLDVKRNMFEEFTKIEDPLLRKKYGADKNGEIRTWDTTFDGTVVAYGQRMSSFGALLKWAPERLKFVKGKGLFEDSPIAKQIDKVANSIEGTTYDKEAFKNYVNDVTNLMFGETTTSPKTVMGRRLMQMSRFSAAAGLSSPLSGAKNLFLGHSSIISILGVKAANEAWKGTLSSEAEVLAMQVGAKQVGTRALAEVGIARIPGTDVGIRAPKVLSWLGGMEPTEWSNRKMSIAASLYYAMDGFKQLSGKETTWFKKTKNNTFLDKMQNEFRLTDDMIGLGAKYGIESNNIPKTHKNYKELKSIQDEMRLRIAQYGHQITQGATGVSNLPLWMNSTLLGKWGTVFQRIAYSMTTNMKRNVVDPLVNHNNPIPLLRYGLSHVASGYVLWQLSDFFLGQESPHKAFDDDESYKEEMSRLLEYAYRGEVGAGFSTLINPMRGNKNQDQGVLNGLLQSIGVVNLRNIENIGSNTIAFLSGKKYAGQTIEDMVKGSMTLANHSLRAFYKNTSPYLTNHQNIRKSLTAYVDANGLGSKYTGGGVTLHENSPIYRKLRHAFMLDKAEGQNGYINTYWSAWWEFVSREIERNPGISRKTAMKSATAKLRGHVQSYSPLFFSENSEQGRIHIENYRSKLTPEYKKMLDKQTKEYNYRIRKFWNNINSQASRFNY